jgi:hypothetical protein
MRRGGTRRPSAVANATGGGSHGASAVLPSPPCPTSLAREKAEEGEKNTRKGLISGVHMAATKRRGRWQAGLSGLKDQLGCC